MQDEKVKYYDYHAWLNDVQRKILTVKRIFNGGFLSHK